MAHPQTNFSSNFQGAEGLDSVLDININGESHEYRPSGGDQTVNVIAPIILEASENPTHAEVSEALGTGAPVFIHLSHTGADYMIPYVGQSGDGNHLYFAIPDAQVSGLRYYIVRNGTTPDVGTKGWNGAISELTRDVIGTSAIDLNTIVGNSTNKAFGVYGWTYTNKDNVSNKPTDNGGIMLVTSYSNKRVLQLVLDSSAEMWARFCYDDNSTWTPWINTRNASWINGGTFNEARIPTELPNLTSAFTMASSRVNISTGEKLSVMFGKIAKFFSDLKTVAFTGNYSDLSGTPTNLLTTTGDGSNVTSTFTKNSNDTSGMTSGGKLSALFKAISDFFASLKAMAFKDNVSDSDINGTIADAHIASASTWNGKAEKNGDYRSDGLQAAYATNAGYAATASSADAATTAGTASYANTAGTAGTAEFAQKLSSSVGFYDTSVFFGGAGGVPIAGFLHPHCLYFHTVVGGVTVITIEHPADKFALANNHFQGSQTFEYNISYTNDEIKIFYKFSQGDTLPQSKNIFYGSYAKLSGMSHHTKQTGSTTDFELVSINYQVPYNNLHYFEVPIDSITVSALNAQLIHLQGEFAIGSYSDASTYIANSTCFVKYDFVFERPNASATALYVTGKSELKFLGSYGING